MPRCGKCRPWPAPACAGVVLCGRASSNLNSCLMPIKTLDYYNNYLVNSINNYIFILKIKLYIFKYK